MPASYCERLTRKSQEYDPLQDSKRTSSSALGPLPRLSQQREARAAGSKKDCGWMPAAAESARRCNSQSDPLCTWRCASCATTSGIRHASLPVARQGASAVESRSK